MRWDLNHVVEDRYEQWVAGEELRWLEMAGFSIHIQRQVLGVARTIAADFCYRISILRRRVQDATD